MKILPELEAYRERLMERAAAWPETSGSDLAKDLEQCLRQIDLLEKAIGDLRRRVAEAPPEEASGVARRVSIQEQTRDLTAAYATVLTSHLDGRVS